VIPRSPWLGGAALAASGALYALLLGTVRRLDRAYPSTDPTESTWWFGYLRDVINVAGVALCALSFRIMGFHGPLALLAGAWFTLAAYGLDYAIARGMSARRAEIVLASILMVAAIVVFRLRGELSDLLAALVGRLF
jgi:hypothetical protein